MSMRRVYTSTANFRAPYDSSNISFAGLGALLSAPGHAAYDINKWPAGRSYYSVHHYRQPYRLGYYQSGALRGPDSQATMTGPQKFALIAVIAGAIVLGVMSDRAKRHG
jgi:hypothetical protein